MRPWEWERIDAQWWTEMSAIQAAITAGFESSKHAAMDREVGQVG